MILGFLLGWAIIFIISYVYQMIRGEQGFGSGDKWLLGALGLWFGYSDIILIFFQSCIISTIYIFLIPREIKNPTNLIMKMVLHCLRN